MGNVPKGKIVFVRQSAFPQESFVYSRGKKRSMTEKGSSFGYVDTFQTRPNNQRFKYCTESGGVALEVEKNGYIDYC